MRSLSILTLALCVAPALAVGGPPLSLPDALARARDRSPRVAAARALAAGAEAAASAAGPAGDPTLDLLTENWRGGDFEARTDLDVTVALTQPLGAWGSRSGRRAVAGGELEQARAALFSTERELELEVAQAFLGALHGRELVDALAAQSDRLRRLVERLRSQVAEGYAAEAHLMKFASEAARVEIELLRARTGAAGAAARLSALLGAPLPEAGLARPPLPAPPAGDPAALAREAAERTPAVRAAAARLARARGATALERARGRGEFAATAGYKRVGEQDTGLFGVSWTLPVFERNRLARARATAEERALAFEYEDARERAAAHLAVFFAAARDLAEAAARVELELIAPAEIARRAAGAAFEEGEASALDLVDAERVFVEARRQGLELTAEAFLAVHEANLIAGQETFR